MGHPLNVGLVGLGRMGLGIAERLVAGGHRVAAFDLRPEARDAARRIGAVPVDRPADLAAAAAEPRVVWLMLPAGQVIDEVLYEGSEALAAVLSPQDVVIDGGNSNFRDSMRRAERLMKEAGIPMLDCGTSGGVEGRRIGYCLMVGGDAEAYRTCEPALLSVAAADGCAHVGPSGAGHFVKMVHNAMEYGFLQVLGEGFAMLDASAFDLDLARLADLWTHGSVIRSWLMELVANAVKHPGHFERIAPKIGGGTTGAWAVAEAGRLGVSMPAIELALAQRKGKPASEFAARMVAALRYEFGRHRFETREP